MTGSSTQGGVASASAYGAPYAVPLSFIRYGQALLQGPGHL